MKRYAWLLALGLPALAVLYSQNSAEHEERENEEQEARFNEDRMKYEFDMTKDPVTGKVPRGIFEKELAFARNLPVRGSGDIRSSIGGTSREMAQNSYIPAGPNNIGGRTRAIAYDLRYASTGVILAGCVSGGIMRSTDGGLTWTLVTPPNEVHAFTAIAQDPTTPDVWYAGGGEPYGNTASEIGAQYMGNGIWKSTDNGATWSKLTLNISGLPAGNYQLESFDHPFDFVHRIAVNPVNGHVYIAGHRRLVRSTDKGATFSIVFEGTTAATATAGQMDIDIASNGRILLAVNGGNPDKNVRGIWVSASGDKGSYARIAGGTTPGVDSVDGWRGNSYNLIQSPNTYSDKRILLDIAPSNPDVAYVFYENGLSSDAPTSKPEADLFRLDISGSTYTWSNRSDNMPNYPPADKSGSDPLAVQGGYDMVVRVKPNDPNTVFVGGTNLYRSTDGFATNQNTTWIAGYRQSPLDYGSYPNTHPDMHELVFNPANPSEAICGDDGGIRKTANIAAGSGSWTATPVTWTQLPNYQTLQYYYVAMDPESNRNEFVGGAQDNGTTLRDKLGLLGTPASDSNNHRKIYGGDGAAVGISRLTQTDLNQYVYGGSQYGDIRRLRITNGYQDIGIKPDNLTPAFPGATDEFGEFVTNFRLDPDNTDNLYYVNFNRLFRTTSASSVAAGGWTELKGVGTAVNPGNPTSGRNVAIRALGFSRGSYATSHVLYIGTTPTTDESTGGTSRQGRIFRLDDPRNAAATAAPVDITPTGLTGNVQDIAVNPNNDEEIIAVVSNYNAVSIWWTNNAKAAQPTWRNAEGNLTLPSFRSCAIVVKKDASNNAVTEYYVGTSVGLYSTVNLGTVLTGSGTPTWQREGGNLLNFAVVQSLAYRPIDNVLLVGTHGNGMFYTYTGTPNFTPNMNTGIDPITNDQNFITSVYPTLTRSVVQYNTGNMFGIKKINVQLLNMFGQQVLQKETGYMSGSIDLNRFASGQYILSIYSEDGKYRHIQKIIKQ